MEIISCHNLANKQNMFYSRWTVGGSRSTWGNPRRHGDNTQLPHRKAKDVRTKNPSFCDSTVQARHQSPHFFFSAHQACFSCRRSLLASSMLPCIFFLKCFQAMFWYFYQNGLVFPHEELVELVEGFKVSRDGGFLQGILLIILLCFSCFRHCWTPPGPSGNTPFFLQRHIADLNASKLLSMPW